MTKKKTLRQREVEALERKTQILEAQYSVTQRLMKPKAETQYKAHEPIPGVLPKGVKTAPVAMDSCNAIAPFANADPSFFGGFVGYTTLTIMAQSGDYRNVPETNALEMTREWGQIKVKGDGETDSSDKITKITEEFERLDVRNMMRKHIENEGIFGMSHMFVKIKGQDDKTDLPLVYENIPKDSLEGFVLIEPIHSSPAAFNAHNPLEFDFYKVKNWFVQGVNIHQDRLLTLVTRPVPDLLKPAYNFGGLSWLQIMRPYVERFQRDTDSISDLISKFSLTALKTNMETILQGGEEGASQLVMRAQMMGQFRDNLNMLLMDMTGEDLVQINTPMTGLVDLWAKSQELMAMPSHTPLVKLTGITPSGLNASSDGEIRVYNDWISGLQNAFILPQIMKILRMVQMSLFGEIDNNIVFEFNSLKQMDDNEQADVNLKKAQTAATLIESGVLSQEDERNRLSNDEYSGYGFIDPKALPEQLDFDMGEESEEKELTDEDVA